MDDWVPDQAEEGESSTGGRSYGRNNEEGRIYSSNADSVVAEERG